MKSDAEIEMLCSAPFSFILPNETVSRLNLAYTPFHWPNLGTFGAYGFTIKEPWEGLKQKKYYAQERKPYDELQNLLMPYHEKWIKADCIAALVPDAAGREFSVQVNGAVLSQSALESPRLRKLMRQRNMPILVTTCNAQISGGGIMPHGGKRSYGIALDIEPLRGIDAIKRQRNKEKYELSKKISKIFVYPVIWDIANEKFFQLFGYHCFKCSSPDFLVIDHHIPIIRGGHLVPGNLVVLCKDCNNRKSDSPPDVFYSKSELDRLQPLLEAQHDIFSFKFDREKWEADKEGYLLSIGVDAQLAHDVLNNPEHHFYIPPQEELTYGVVISIGNDPINSGEGS